MVISNIVKIIHQQLLAGGRIKVMSWGATAFHQFDEYTLRFKVQGHHHKGLVEVFLTPMDVYRVRLLEKDGVTTKKEINDVYCDELTDVIDTAVEKISTYKR